MMAGEARPPPASPDRTSLMQTDVDERNPRGTLRLQGAEMEEVEDFKNWGSTVKNNRMKKKGEEAVGVGWNGGEKSDEEFDEN